MLQVCLEQSWPQDKPIAQIVFPQILSSPLGDLVTLWVMLPQQEIQYRLFSKLHRQFLFTESPYPMLLWITALYTQECGSRWLPCYLDLKESKCQEIARRLAETGYYRILLFPLEEPQRCTQVMTATLSADQCQWLRAWVKASKTLQPLAEPINSRRLLKTEFEKLKSQHPVKLNFSDFCDRVLPMAL